MFLVSNFSLDSSIKFISLFSFSFSLTFWIQKFWTGPQIASPFIVRDCRTNYSQLKLDSRFIRDVTILDGTIMAPSTPFTKVWRMRNCGSVAWPKGCQLLWIGGEKMCNMESIELEVGL